MSEDFAREVGLLRAIVPCLEERPLPTSPLTQHSMREERLGHVREMHNSMLAIRMPGHLHFSELSECILKRFPALARGADHSELLDELFTLLFLYLGRDAASIDKIEVGKMMENIRAWSDNKCKFRHLYIPCVLTPTPARRFIIGPVTFEHLDCVKSGDFFPNTRDLRSLGPSSFDALLDHMRKYKANWLARIEVPDCHLKRAEDIGDLAVDLAIVALQLVAPNLNTHNMARLDAFRGCPNSFRLSESQGSYVRGSTSNQPGLSIGRGVLEDILQKAASPISAVSHVLQSFASGHYRLPILEQAWCDAAYWYHQALAETIDTIAMAKLQTALEVLVRALVRTR